MIKFISVKNGCTDFVNELSIRNIMSDTNATFSEGKLKNMPMYCPEQDTGCVIEFIDGTAMYIEGIGKKEDSVISQLENAFNNNTVTTIRVNKVHYARKK